MSNTNFTKEDIKLAAKGVSDKEVDNIIGSWEVREEFDKIEYFNKLVALGESRQIAVFTVVLEKEKPVY